MRGSQPWNVSRCTCIEAPEPQVFSFEPLPGSECVADPCRMRFEQGRVRHLLCVGARRDSFVTRHDVHVQVENRLPRGRAV